ncbi:ATP-binding protein [Rhizobium leguminosarum]|uniref:AlbA family DNA-binding domain-containing protein n=1 Tax=Rhizobium leguminosarum TaxID=384 RepID=UPI001C9524B4|nr:ATP-binding protein [Rhizobium leguminosarum]MBY5816592.1 ATP-binding protein [Rhizobium leguminosarum]
MRYDYNPFDKSFDEINPSDLAILFSVAEGWYVEYKQEVPNASAIAKSVTAFANTYGGWLFYGIAEKSKDDAVAGTFPGIACEDADGVLQRIRQAVANHAQPSPYFRVKALMGPVEAIGLPEGRCVIMAQVPWGPEAPYIHKDGRIYRRVGDGSEPRPESDRFILDQLWSRSVKITQKYADWIGRELETSEAEENSPYVRLFLIADFWSDHSSMNGISLRRVREIISDVNGNYTIPFENVYQTSGGFICRQTAYNDPEMLGLTWKLGGNFQSEVIIPLSKFRSDSLDDLGDGFEGYKHIGRFLQLCEKQRYLRPTVIDLNILLHVLLGIARIQTALAKEFGWTGPVFAKMEISGVWRTIPFVDTSYVLDEYEKHGLPLGLRDKISIRTGTDQGSFIELDGLQDDDIEKHRILMATKLFVIIALALGIPPIADPDGDGSDFSDSVADFLKAGERALEAQKKRTQRG